MKLIDQKCRPCQEGGTPLSLNEAQELAREVPSWSFKANEIEREFKFNDFRQAVDFVNQVAEIAEEEDHHPDIYISYSKVRLSLSTHKIGGLSSNDFILAAKIDRLVD